MAEETTIETTDNDTADTSATVDTTAQTDATATTEVAKTDANTDAQKTPAGSEATTEAKPAAKVDAKPDAKAAIEKAPDWPDDWREKAAGGDAKILARLTRYASPKAVADALIAAQNKISSGDVMPKLKKDATPEQIKEYRESLGIPEAPDKYDISAYKLSDDDKALLTPYLAKAHASNQTTEQVKAGIDAYIEINAKKAEELQTRDSTIMRENEDALRSEWGNDYRRNINLVNAFLDSAPQGLKDKFLKGRLADGTPIASDGDTLRWLLQLELERNPVGVVTPSGGGDMAKTVDAEIAQIEESMRKDRKAYDRDEKLQKRYRDLLEYRINQQEKAKKAA